MMAKDTDAWMPFYVSDYLRDTRHLSTKEHGAYLLLIMHAWVNDGALPSDPVRIARIAGLDAKEWRESGAVLMAFFIETPEGYRSDRVDRELARANALVEQRREAGKASAAQRALQRDGNGRSTDVLAEGQRNRRPSPSPSPSKGSNEPSDKARAFAAPCPEGVEVETWDGFLEVRKRKRAPITEKAYRLIVKALEQSAGTPDETIAQSVMNGWTGVFAIKGGANGRAGKPSGWA